MSIDFIAGCLGGCAGLVVGHPLDTIKVHMQTQNTNKPIYRGTWHCMKTIVQKDTVRGLYRGMSSPMAGVGLVNAIIFGVYGNVQRHLENPDALHSHFIAGSVAGLMQSIVCSPMELAKTRIQLQANTGKGLVHKGPWDCLKYIARTEGVRGVFKGLGITALRDIPGFSIYFLSYEYLMRLSTTPNALHCLLAGGFAGSLSWLGCSPMDVIKTCIQADGMDSKPKFKGAIDCMSKGYRAEGLHFFVRGLNSSLIRAFPMNAACFFVVSLIMQMSKSANVDITVHSAEPLTMVGIGSTPICHIHKHSNNEDKEDLERKRFSMARSLIVFGAFNEAVCHTEVEELANEFYSDNCNYYLFEDKRLQQVGNVVDRE